MGLYQMSEGTLYDAIADAGYAIPGSILWDGVLHRFATNADKPHSKDGWYVAHDDAKGKAASFGSWRLNTKHVWSNGSGRILNPEELRTIHEAQEKAKDAIKRMADQAALRASRLYEQAIPIEVAPYLKRKGIRCPEGVRAIEGMSSRAFGFDGSERQISGLVVPMRNKAGQIRSLQIIPHDSCHQKLFMKGGQIAGCFHALGDITTAKILLIAEGLATAQSLREAIPEATVVIAFSAGNVTDVAQSIRSMNVSATIVICADDDIAGRKAAEAASAAVNGRTVLPTHGVNDFNDLHSAQGVDAVRQAILGDDNEDWRSDLIIHHKKDGTQSIPCRVHNLILILQNAAEFKGRLRFNAFSGQPNLDGVDMDDVGPIAIKAALEKQWIPEKIPSADVMDALQVVASHDTFHPVRDYLNSLTWDGTERIPYFFEDFCGSVRDAYHIAVARSLFVSAVARIYKPGCKVDTMVILESPQGRGKSKLWLTLFGDWCSEVTASLNDKDFYSGMRGFWCLDFAELDAFSRAEATQIKRILTSQSDNYRPHYGRVARSFPRQCIFVGGTNRDDWHTDATGARRFLPVKITSHIDIQSIACARDQLWAEAVARFHHGETWWDIPDAEEHQEGSYVGDPWDERVMEYCFGRDRVTTSEILGDACLRIETGRQTRSDQMRISAILKRMGMERNRIGDGKWGYSHRKQ